MWPIRRGSTPKPDYNRIRQLEIELGMVDPPAVTQGNAHRVEVAAAELDRRIRMPAVVEQPDRAEPKLAVMTGEDWFKVCRGE